MLPILLLLFVGSGCAALIYEIVWFQLLQQVIGSSAVSLGILLGTFMGGMCVGSLALARMISPSRHPLKVYAVLEFGIGILGLIVPFAVPYVGQLYVAGLVHGLPGLLWRGVLSAGCLLPPTFLMGATFPALARWVRTAPRGVCWLGWFYGGNIAGAVLGCLLAGFYLLRAHDMPTATYVAASINGCVAGVSLLIARVAVYQPTLEPAETSGGNPRGVEIVHLVIALSGLCALGAEVVWTRLLSLILGGTVYTFSIILAVFLAGLGLGSSAGASLATRTSRPGVLLAGCQLVLVGMVFLAAFEIARWLPWWSGEFGLASRLWFKFPVDVARCACAVLPAAFWWGMSFPLALAVAARPGQDSGQLVGSVYAANTVGAIAGALGFSLFAIGTLGTQNSQRLLMGLALTASVVMAGSLTRSAEGVVAGFQTRWRRRPAAVIGVPCLAVAALVMIWGVPKLPEALVAYGRKAAWFPRLDTLYVGEGLNASIAVTQGEAGARRLHINGKVVVSTEPHDMRVVRMLAHLPALFHPSPKSVLVVGCGAGITAGTFLDYPGVERIVICEIEPLIPEVAGRFFSEANRHVLEDPRVEIIHDDARHFISTSREKFDIITSDPINPWMKGAAVLYTTEYFQLAKQHLNPGGLVTQWVPLYESDAAVVKSELATFFQVFDSGTVWGNESNGKGFDVVLLGTPEPLQVNLAQLRAKLTDPHYSAAAGSLREVEFGSAVDLVATYAGQAADLRGWLAGAVINRDRNLRLQYLAGLAIESQQSDVIYRDLLRRRTLPAWFTAASEQQRAALEEKWRRDRIRD